jgi:uncharacterized protein YheU (UPF0270 family)
MGATGVAIHLARDKVGTTFLHFAALSCGAAAQRTDCCYPLEGPTYKAWRVLHRAHAFDTRAPMLIPYDQLEADTLTRLIEDFVTRDGTDNGDETPLETRVLRVRHALSKGQAVIFFDLESQQCQLMLKHDVPKEFFD